MISNEKECGKGINEPMLHFDSDVFFESEEKERRKGNHISTIAWFQNPAKWYHLLPELISKNQ
jgi:hypothetical protein